MCLNGVRLKIRTSTCFLYGSRAPNSSAFERNYCRTALLTCLYFAFICSSYTKHTFMVDRTGFKPAINLPCKGSGFDHSHHRPIKISFTHQSCLQASILTTSLWIKSACSLQWSCSPCSALESNHQQPTESYRRSHCHCTETNCYCGHFTPGELLMWERRLNAASLKARSSQLNGSEGGSRSHS